MIMTDIIERLWTDFEAEKIDPALGPEIRADFRTAFAAGCWSVYTILEQLEVLDLPPDLRGPALERLAEGIEAFNAATLAAARR